MRRPEARFPSDFAPLFESFGGCDQPTDETASLSRSFLCRRAARPSAVRKRRADRPIIGMARSAAPGVSTPHPQARSAPARSERREGQCGFLTARQAPPARLSKPERDLCRWESAEQADKRSGRPEPTQRQDHRPGEGSARRSARCLKGFGSPSRTRTCDKAINSRLLYQLSYRGSPGRLGGAGGSLAVAGCGRKGPGEGFCAFAPGAAVGLSRRPCETASCIVSV